ncbi:hypothetical protein Dole_1835 [Desulfosudis oleivorans Hxd3]|uniref:Sulfotransferase family protein n=1 Tax=Desulfosudis oleivorans (strain DSM 6200 / JCM 39069 / Hxd3) TaxID=96561 RepID=A8ZSA2_DESOH|nr:hypothetical protein Dole_1835 [Desulfosudis oleivorans Hxd3]
MASLLNNIPDICCTPEAEILSKLLLTGNAKDPVSEETIKIIETAMASDPKLSFWNLTLSDLDIRFGSKTSKEEMLFSILRAYGKKNKPDANVLIFKCPILNDYLKNCCKNEDLIRSDLFFLALLRDPRASFESQKRSKSLNEFVMDASPRHSAHKWVKFHNMIKNIKAFNCGYVVKYEELILNPTNTLTKICDALRLNATLKNVLVEGNSYYHSIPYNQKKLHQGLLNPFNTEKIDSWKKALNGSEIFLIEIIAKQQIKEWDYKLFSPHPNFINLMIVFCVSEFKSFLNRSISFFRKTTIKYKVLKRY